MSTSAQPHTVAQVLLMADSIAWYDAPGVIQKTRKCALERERQSGRRLIAVDRCLANITFIFIFCRWVSFAAEA